MTASTARKSARTANGGASTSNGSSTTAATPQPEPAPATPVNFYQQYADRMAAIMRGEVTAPEKLFQPLISADPNRVTVIGPITNPMTRECFSLRTELHVQAVNLPYPKNFAELEKFEKDYSTLQKLAGQAEKHAWTLVKAEFPGQAERGSLSVSDGWILVRKPDYQDQLRKAAEDRYGDLECDAAKHFIRSHLEARKREGANERKSDPFAKNDDDSLGDSHSPSDLLGALNRLEHLAGFRRHF